MMSLGWALEVPPTPFQPTHSDHLIPAVLARGQSRVANSGCWGGRSRVPLDESLTVEPRSDPPQALSKTKAVAHLCRAHVGYSEPHKDRALRMLGSVLKGWQPPPNPLRGNPTGAIQVGAQPWSAASPSFEPHAGFSPRKVSGESAGLVSQPAFRTHRRFAKVSQSSGWRV